MTRIFLVAFGFFAHFSFAQSSSESDSLKSQFNKSSAIIQSINGNDLPVVPTFSLDQALVGNIAGGMVTSMNGAPGFPATIRLRGFNTLSNSAQPLILVDGVQLGGTQLNKLDPGIVDHIEILPGSAAGATYGFQGANGVILISTKRASKGKLAIDASSSFGLSKLLNNGNVSKAGFHNYQSDSAGDLLDINGQKLKLNPDYLFYSDALAYDLLDPDGIFNKSYNANYKYQDHVDQFLKWGMVATNSISAATANDILDARFSVSDNRVTGNFDNGADSRTNVSLNLGAAITKQLTIRSVSQLVFSDNSVNPFQRQAFYGLMNTRPFVDYSLKDTNGNHGLFYGIAGGANGSNPNYYFQYSKKTDHAFDWIQNIQATYKFTKNISITAQYRINKHREDEVITIHNQSANLNTIFTESYLQIDNTTDKTGERNTRSTDNFSQNVLLNATAEVDFEKDLKLNFPIESVTSANASWLKLDDRYLQKSEMTAGILPGLQEKRLNRANGLWLRQSFEYDKWIELSGTWRKDVVDHLLDNGQYYQGAIQATPSMFKFWKASDVMSKIEFRLRAATGKAGIPPFVSLYDRNKSATWETSIEKETGFDIGLSTRQGKWFSRSGFSFTWWTSSNSESAYYSTLPVPIGLPGYVSFFSLNSSGVQLTLHSTVYAGQNLTWNFLSHFNQQSVQLHSTKNGQSIILKSGDTQMILQSGNGIGQIYGNKLLTHVDQRDKDGDFYIPQSQQANYQVAGNAYVVDPLTRRPLATYDQYALGNSQPKFNASFINEFNIKKIVTLSFQFDWIFKSHLYNQTKEWMYRDAIHSDYDRPVTMGNVAAAWTSFYRGVYEVAGRNATTSYFYEDASFVRLRNVAITTDLLRLIKITKLRKLQLELTARNIWTLTDYTGMDPEINSGDSQSAWNNGIDNNTLPNFKSFQIGVRIGI